MYDWMPKTSGEQIVEIAKLLVAFFGPLVLVFGPMLLLLVGG
jgi:hypothetical protein